MGDKSKSNTVSKSPISIPSPGKASIENDPRYDGYRRDFLTILQINPRRRVLANNSASDPCAFTLFIYSMMAVHLPTLAEGLSANDILRQSLDRYVGEMKGYGISNMTISRV